METLLRVLSAVHPLSDELIDYLGEIVKPKEIQKGDFLLKAGHVCRNIYFIEKGLLRCYYEKGSLDVSSWFMKDLDVIVSVESFYQQTISYEWIQALEDCILYYISYSDLFYIFKTYPEFNYIARELTQHYYIQWTQLLYALRMKTAKERYEWLMERYPDFVLRIPAKYLASWLRVSEYHFSVIKQHPGKKSQ